MSIELKLSRSSRIYCPNEFLEGKIILKLNSSISHQGVRITANGTVNLQVRGGSAGVIESFYGVIKPVHIMNKSVEVKPSGKLSSGTTEISLVSISDNSNSFQIPFSMVLKEKGKDDFERFYETYHGANISIQYLITADITRGYLHKSLSATMEFIIESEKDSLYKRPMSPEMVSFYITQDTQRHPLLPELLSGRFRVTGKIPTQCSLSDPLTGELTVEASAVPIRSIDIHVLRMESILVGEKYVTETSVIQTTQVADGDGEFLFRYFCFAIYELCFVIHTWLSVPVSLQLPFSIEFQVSIVITFQSELSKLQPKADPRTPRLWLALETLPLRLFRAE
ncbi:hypothetical protein Syun_022551 [Stephania yunnanensis]|uniref:Down syndrome critical region protein 3 n=1 Tax=Stephania yunnanensis TaxID=152371 RepID=A0AAP0F770_9MAGN